jgi:hypothetical protein
MWHIRAGGKVNIVFWRGNVRERDDFEDPVVDGRIILKLIFSSGVGRTDWIHLVEDRDG